MKKMGTLKFGGGAGTASSRAFTTALSKSAGAFVFLLLLLLVFVSRDTTVYEQVKAGVEYVPASSTPTPPGASYGFAMNGRVWWHKLKETDRFPVGSFDYSGVTFTAVSVGGGEMNLTSIAIKFSVMTSRDSTRNQPHFFKAFLHEYDSAAQLPDQWDFIPPPTTASSLVSVVNFSTASWENGTIVEQKLFEKDQINPLKTYICSVVKITEPNYGRRAVIPNFVTIHDLVLFKEREERNSLEHSLLESMVKSSAAIPSTAATESESKKELLQRRRPERRRLFFVGDSITCGFGVQGTSNSSTNRTDVSKEDYSESFSFLVSQRLRAARSAICWSGIGLVRYCCLDENRSNNTGRTMFRRVVATAAGPWKWESSSRSFVPDAVVINLGTNDFANRTIREFNSKTNSFLSRSEVAAEKDYDEDVSAKFLTQRFYDAYISFLAEISETLGRELFLFKNRRLVVVLACGPMALHREPNFCSVLKHVKNFVEKSQRKQKSLKRKEGVVMFDHIRPVLLRFDEMEDEEIVSNHPNILGNLKMANKLEKLLRKELGWK